MLPSAVFNMVGMEIPFFGLRFPRRRNRCRGRCTYCSGTTRTEFATTFFSIYVIPSYRILGVLAHPVSKLH